MTTTAEPVKTEKEKADEEFQNNIVKECASEVFAVKKPKTVKRISTIMKKYEDKIYERYIKKTSVRTLDKKEEKEQLINAAMSGVKFPFVGDASFLTNYNRLLRGYKDEATFNPQQELPYEVKVRMPAEMGIYQPKNQFSTETKNYVDTHANSKYYFPQDHAPTYDNMNIYTNKPMGDISNQQNFFMSQLDKAGMLDPYGQQNYGSPTLPPNRNPMALSGSQFMRQSATPGPYQNEFGFQPNSVLSPPPFGGPQINAPMVPPLGGSLGGPLGGQLGGQLGGPLGSPHIGGPIGGPMTPGTPGNPMLNPQLGPGGYDEESYKLRRNIDLLGGIQRTIPNMERSLRDNELKTIEQNFKYQAYPDNTSNMRLNNLMQNPMTNMYSPQFDNPASAYARSSSPIRGGYPGAHQPNVYYSPSKSPYPADRSYPVDQEDEIKRSSKKGGLFEREVLSEKSINTPKKPSFASSKSLRGEKAEILNVRYEIPPNYGLVNEGQE